MSDAEQDDKVKEAMQQAAQQASELLTKNTMIRRSAASLIAGFGVGNLAMARIDEVLEKIDLGGAEPGLVRTVILDTLRRESTAMNAAQLRHLLRTEVQTLVNGWGKPAQEERLAGTGKLMIETGSPVLDQGRLAGGLRDGSVLLLQGTDEATWAYMQHLIDTTIRAGIAVTFMAGERSTASRVTMQPLSWWGGALADHAKGMDVFSTASVGKRALICVDDIALLGAGSGAEESGVKFYRDLSAKLRRAAKRVHLPVVARIIRADGQELLEWRSANSLIVLSNVVLRDGVLTVDGERVEQS